MTPKPYIEVTRDGDGGAWYHHRGGLLVGTLAKAAGDPEGKPAALVKAAGFATTEARDHSKHRIVQTGINWDIFMGKGRRSPGPVTYEHPIGVSNLVGFPTLIESRLDDDGTPGTWVETALYGELDLVKAIVDKARLFERYGSHQSFGWSVEGSIDAKPVPGDGGLDIMKSSVFSLAITLVPQNHRTWLTLAASLSMAGSVPHATPEPAVAADGTQASILAPVSFDVMVATVCKSFPHLSWAASRDVVHQILETAGPDIRQRG